MDGGSGPARRVSPSWTAFGPFLLAIFVVVDVVVAHVLFGLFAAIAFLPVTVVGVVPRGHRGWRAAAVLLSVIGCGFGVAAFVVAEGVALHIAAAFITAGAALAAITVWRRT